jgi:hypothetical protein
VEGPTGSADRGFPEVSYRIARGPDRVHTLRTDSGADRIIATDHPRLSEED